MNKTFGVTIGSMASVNTTAGGNYGQKITDAVINLAFDADIGLRTCIDEYWKPFVIDEQC